MIQVAISWIKVVQQQQQQQQQQQAKKVKLKTQKANVSEKRKKNVYQIFLFQLRQKHCNLKLALQN
jgi:hypothetical protein